MTKEEIRKIKRRLKQENLEMKKAGKRKLHIFRMPDIDIEKAVFQKGYYLNHTCYYIYEVNREEGNHQFLTFRLTSTEEKKYIISLLGDYAFNESIDLSLSNNMREAINVIKNDANNKRPIKDFFDIEKYSSLYKELKKAYKEIFIAKENN